MFYHAYDDREPAFVDGTWNRILMTDRIEWEDGWPVVAGDGTPSYQSRMPHSGDTGPVSDGVYRIENAATGNVLEVYESATTDGANVVQWSGTAVRISGGGWSTSAATSTGSSTRTATERPTFSTARPYRGRAFTSGAGGPNPCRSGS